VLSRLLPSILRLVIVIQKLPEHQQLEYFFEGDHASSTSVVLIIHHRKVHIFSFQLIDSVQKGHVLIQFCNRLNHIGILECFVWGAFED